MDEQNRLEEIKERLAQIAVEVLILTETIKRLLRELESIQLGNRSSKEGVDSDPSPSLQE